jgi:hypothetical protein
VIETPIYDYVVGNGPDPGLAALLACAFFGLSIIKVPSAVTAAYFPIFCSASLRVIWLLLTFFNLLYRLRCKFNKFNPKLIENLLFFRYHKMSNIFLKTIEQLYHKKVDATGLAVFRISIGLVLFWEVLQLFRYRHLIFDKIPYISFSNIDFKYALLLWLLVIFCLIFGLFTRISTIVNYVLSLVFFATIDNFGNHMLNVLMSINFLLMFTDVNNVLSLDAVIVKLRAKEPNHIKTKVSVLQYYSFVFMALGLVYFTSIFDKLFTDYWRNGLILWKFLSVPTEFARVDLSFFLNHKVLMQIAAYITLIFESVFIFICFSKRLRVYTLIIGVLLHLGILICLPISPFALGFLSLYVLLIPFSFWRFLSSLFHPNKKIQLFINTNFIWAKQIKVVLQSFDFFKIFECCLVNLPSRTFENINDTTNIFIITPKGDITDQRLVMRYAALRMPVLLLVVFFTFIPYSSRIIRKVITLIFTVSYCSTTPKNNKKFNPYKIKIIGLSFICITLLQCHALLATKLSQYIGLPFPNKQISHASKTLLGVGTHGVFTYNYNKTQIYSIGIAKMYDDKEIWLPLTKKDGSHDYYKNDPIRGRSFFALKGPALDSTYLNHYVRDYTAFWSFNNNTDLDHASFNVYIKRLQIPDTWEKDVYKKNLDKAWVPLGRVVWKDTIYNSELNHLRRID